MQTGDVAIQFNNLSMQDNKKKRKPRKSKNKTQLNAKSTSFQPDQDYHATFPDPIDMAPKQPRRRQQDPNLVRYVPYDDYAPSSYRSLAFHSINPATQRYPDPVAPPPPPTFRPINRHPSSFFVPSHAADPHHPAHVHPTRSHIFFDDLAPYFSQPYIQPELPVPEYNQSRRSTRQAARQSPSQQPVQLPPASQPIQRQRFRSPKPDKRPRAVGKLLRPTPSLPYLVNSLVTSPTLDRPKSLLVVLDLNGVLAFRKKRTKGYKPRPNLDTFLDYLFDSHHVMIWSSGMPENVERIIERMLSSKQRKQLVAIWSRDKLRLPDNLFGEKVQVYKQLSWVWEDPTLQMNAPLGGWSQRDTVLVDDSIDKAAAEPHNLIEVDEFTGEPEQSENTTLLDVIAYLERIRWHENVSAEMRATPFVVSKP
ncbi:HAD-like protein [Aureobasidium subglaciale]|nr:HAD-like protein [Aureobasidium subglaciale]